MSPELLAKPQPPWSITTHVSCPHTNPSAASGAEGGMQVLWPPPKQDSSSKYLTCEAIKGLTILSSNLSPHDMLWAAPNGS